MRATTTWETADGPLRLMDRAAFMLYQLAGAHHLFVPPLIPQLLHLSTPQVPWKFVAFAHLLGEEEGDDEQLPFMAREPRSVKRRGGGGRRRLNDGEALEALQDLREELEVRAGGRAGLTGVAVYPFFIVWCVSPVRTCWLCFVELVDFRTSLFIYQPVYLPALSRLPVQAFGDTGLTPCELPL